MLSPRSLLPLFPILLWIFSCISAHAQISVSIDTKRKSYLLDEPLLVNIHIQNLAGQPITLEDSKTDGAWCHLQIKAVRGDFVRSRATNLTFPPVPIPTGETAHRAINISSLYSMSEAGQYTVRACITHSATHKQFWSEAVLVNVDPGKLIWNQTVGIPEGRPGAGSYRTFSIFTHQRPEGTFLFAKLENREDVALYGCYPLGRLLGAMAPQIQLDPNNDLYVFHANSDTAYTLSQIDVSTGTMGQAPYRSSNPNRQGRPSLQRSASGQLVIRNGTRITEEEINNQNNPNRAKISDRPPGF